MKIKRIFIIFAISFILLFISSCSLDNLRSQLLGTSEPTQTPTVTPTAEPTQTPTVAPTQTPTIAPTVTPTVIPTQIPTVAPTVTPTAEPTQTPTVAPTQTPTVAPTVTPTVIPTQTTTIAPTVTPTAEPTQTPTVAPTAEPTQIPTVAPTVTPTVIPTQIPTVVPSVTPTITPSQLPTIAPTTLPELINDDVIYSNFQIHFLTVGNEYTGDSTYIKAGDIDILIDAGSKQNSADDITSYVDKYCKDNVLEYVIVTHGHLDHYGGFIGNSTGSSYNGIFYKYKVGTIIEYGKTSSSGATYQKYETARNTAIAGGAKYYKANELFNNTSAQNNVFDLGNDMSFTVLYNKYYFETSSDENDHSVCTLFTYKDHNFLFTGDLEEKGEEYLVEYYDNSTPEKTLPEVDLFKAGHHGSGTSSNEKLLNKINPKMCAVCCCAGSTEYTANYQNIFPTQAFIDRIAKYTDRVYVTSYLDEQMYINGISGNKFKDLNGNICVSSNGLTLGVKGSNNTTKLKDTAWFNQKIYVKAGNNGAYNICSGTKKTDFYTQNTSGVIEVPRRTWPTYN